MQTLARRDFLLQAGLAGAGLLAAGDACPAAERKVPFRLGLVTYMVGSAYDLPTLLKVCREAEIAAVECRTTHAHGVEPALGAAERTEVKKRFADSGVTFWGCGSVCEFHDPDPAKVRKNVEDCKAFIGLVRDLGGKGVKVRPNGLPKGVEVAKTLSQIASALRECGKAAADAGVEIWVEVHGAGTQEPANMKAILSQCDHPAVGATWNSNPTDVKDGSVAAAFALLKPWIKSCHINDLENDARKTYPYRELFGLLGEMKYDRFTLCEVGKAFPKPEEGVAFLQQYRRRWQELTQG